MPRLNLYINKTNENQASFLVEEWMSKDVVEEQRWDRTFQQKQRRYLLCLPACFFIVLSPLRTVNVICYELNMKLVGGSYGGLIKA